MANTDADGPQAFEVEEVLTEHGELLVLSLGFASPSEPLDVLHMACGRQRSGCEPPLLEDELYLERTDQSMACDGRDVRRLVGRHSCIELELTEAGAASLALSRVTRFHFNAHPELHAIAVCQLAAMARAGQPRVRIDDATTDEQASAGR